MAFFILADVTSDFSMTPLNEPSNEQKTFKRFLKEFGDLPHAYYRGEARKIAMADVAKSIKYQVKWTDAVGRELVVPAKLVESDINPQVTSPLSQLPNEILSALIDVLNSHVKEEAQLKTPYPDIVQCASSMSTGAAALALTCKKLCAISQKSRVMVYEGFVGMMGWYKPNGQSALCHGCCNVVSTVFGRWVVDTPTRELGGVSSVESRCKPTLVEWLDGPNQRSQFHNFVVRFGASNDLVGQTVQEWCNQSWEFNELSFAGWCPMCLAQIMHEKWITGGLISDDNAFKQLDLKVTQWVKDHQNQISSNFFEMPHTKDSLWVMTSAWLTETRWMRPGPRSWSANTMLTAEVT